MANFTASPSVGDEISKGSTRYKFNGVGWSPVHRSTYRGGTLVVTKATWFFLATAGQTVITGNDAASETLNYDVNAEIEVNLNGIKIREGASDDYVLTSPTVLTFNSALKANDEVDIIQRTRFSDTDVYTKAEIDAKLNNVSDTDLTDYYMGNL